MAMPCTTGRSSCDPTGVRAGESRTRIGGLARWWRGTIDAPKAVSSVEAMVVEVGKLSGAESFSTKSMGEKCLLGEVCRAGNHVPQSTSMGASRH